MRHAHAVALCLCASASLASPQRDYTPLMLAEKRGKEGKEAAAVLCKHGARGALLYTVNKTCTDSRAEQARERGREGETERERAARSVRSVLEALISKGHCLQECDE